MQHFPICVMRYVLCAMRQFPMRHELCAMQQFPIRHELCAMRQFPMRYTRAMRHAQCVGWTPPKVAALWTRMIWATFARAARSMWIGAKRLRIPLDCFTNLSYIIVCCVVNK